MLIIVLVIIDNLQLVTAKLPDVGVIKLSDILIIHLHIKRNFCDFKFKDSAPALYQDILSNACRLFIV